MASLLPVGIFIKFLFFFHICLFNNSVLNLRRTVKPFLWLGIFYSLQATARLKGAENEFSKARCYIDGSYLPENCKLKLEKLPEEDRMSLPGPHTQQYRLIPVEENGTKVRRSVLNILTYAKSCWINQFLWSTSEYIRIQLLFAIWFRWRWNSYETIVKHFVLFFGDCSRRRTCPFRL